MKQIKTIRRADPEDFDREVNAALEDGWTLVRRSLSTIGFLAELEREIITEAEKCCENCEYCDYPNTRKPCADCDDDCSCWEEAKG